MIAQWYDVHNRVQNRVCFTHSPLLDFLSTHPLPCSAFTQEFTIFPLKNSQHSPLNKAITSKSHLSWAGILPLLSKVHTNLQGGDLLFSCGKSYVQLDVRIIPKSPSIPPSPPAWAYSTLFASGFQVKGYSMPSPFVPLLFASVTVRSWAPQSWIFMTIRRTYGLWCGFLATMGILPRPVNATVTVQFQSGSGIPGIKQVFSTP